MFKGSQQSCGGLIKDKRCLWEMGDLCSIPCTGTTYCTVYVSSISAYVPYCIIFRLMVSMCLLSVRCFGMRFDLMAIGRAAIDGRASSGFK